MNNADPNELDKFSQLAHRWWDPNSEFKPLHEINPLRLGWIETLTPLSGRQVVDIGCGGGILAESMAARGARVTGVDLSRKALEVARLHLLESGRSINYREISAEALADEQPASFDIVTCMELLEHVPDPVRTIKACATLVKPGGHVFFSTVNRNPKSYLLAIIGAEYILRMLPKGTHDFTRFIRPSELTRWAGMAGLDAQRLSGLTFNPLTGKYRLCADCSVNYLAHTVRPTEPS